MRQITRLFAAAALILTLSAASGPATAQMQSATDIISSWPAPAKQAANQMITKYGEPQGVTPSRLVWQDTGPWQEIVVYRDIVPHRFPMEHRDTLEQSIPYQVPPDKFDELAAFDGSVIVARTKGTMAAMCDREEANFLALNLANDIIRKNKSVDEARDQYAQIIKDLKEGKRHPYTQGFQFQVASIDRTRYPDEAVIG